MSTDNRAKKKGLNQMQQVAAGNELRLANYADVAELDFAKVLEKAVEIFSDQAMLDKDISAISVKDLEISKAKANNFLDAIAGVVEISHQVEVISAAKDNFKRSDELNVLNSLRRSCELGANGVEKLLTKAVQYMEYLSELPAEEVTVEQLANMQAVMNENIGTSQKLIASLSRLIQLERLSGNRPYGSVRSSTLSVGHIKAFGEEDLPGVRKSAARPLSSEELKDLIEDDEDSAYDD
ncbi:MAG: hypothetical protein E4H07_08645 [Nitrosomonadales bacterium]|nr:MAG: hypothetical protein E4H07_08645 [Nitrosomonadales bacterium]